MIKIIPTNFALNKKEFENKLIKLKFSKNIHLDFMDGVFTSKKSVSFENMNYIEKYSDKNFEIHLMAYNPIKYLENLIKYKINKVLIQIEVFNNELDLIDTIKTFKNNNIKVFLVLNPKTNINKVKSFLKIVDGVMLMSVVPGKEGQKFIETTFEKIKLLRKLDKNILIQLDGGINEKNIFKFKDSSINILSIGSYISSSENPKLNFKKIVNILN